MAQAPAYASEDAMGMEAFYRVYGAPGLIKAHELSEKGHVK